MLSGFHFFSEVPSFPGASGDSGAIDTVTLSDAVFDNLLASSDLRRTPETPFQDEWDFHTLMKCNFSDGQINAGNVDFIASQISGILLRHREKGTFSWTTFFYQPVSSYEDLHFTAIDRFCKAGTDYEFAMVPISGYMTELSYQIQTVHSDFRDTFLMDLENSFRLYMNLSIDVERRNTGIRIDTLGSAYPCTWHLSAQNYTSGSLSTRMMELCGCTPDETHAASYRKRFMDFLCSGKAKLLKHFDGRIWLILVEDAPTESTGSYWNLPETSFRWYETGDVASTKDLGLCGMTDVPAEWW